MGSMPDLWPSAGSAAGTVEKKVQKKEKIYHCEVKKSHPIQETCPQGGDKIKCQAANECYMAK